MSVNDFGLFMIYALNLVLSIGGFFENVADCILTDQVIKHGGYEANGRMAWIMRVTRFDFPILGVVRFQWALKLAITIGVFFLIWTYVHVQWQRTILLVMFDAAFLYAVLHNSGVRDRQRARGKG